MKIETKFAIGDQVKITTGAWVEKRRIETIIINKSNVVTYGFSNGRVYYESDLEPAPFTVEITKEEAITLEKVLRNTDYLSLADFYTKIQRLI
jgi:hypothetical protein